MGSLKTHLGETTKLQRKGKSNSIAHEKYVVAVSREGEGLKWEFEKKHAPVDKGTIKGRNERGSNN